MKLLSLLLLSVPLLATASASANELLIGFDLSGNDDILEIVPHNRTSFLHQDISLVSGVWIPVQQATQTGPGLQGRVSNVVWSFLGIGNADLTTGREDSKGITFQSSLENDLYLSFTIAPAPGKSLDLSEADLAVHYQFIGGSRITAPTYSAAVTSITGFDESNVVAVSTDLIQKVAVYQFAHPGLRKITEPVEIRIYYWRPEGGATYGSGINIMRAGAIPDAPGASIALFGVVQNAR